MRASLRKLKSAAAGIGGALYGLDQQHFVGDAIRLLDHAYHSLLDVLPESICCWFVFSQASPPCLKWIWSTTILFSFNFCILPLVPSSPHTHV